jgi:hypothetical protein
MLSDDPNNVIRASKFIRTIALKNLDNPAEEPSLKSKDTSGSDAFGKATFEFNEKLNNIDEGVRMLESAMTVLNDRYSLDVLSREVEDEEFLEEIRRQGRWLGSGMKGFKKSKNNYQIPKIPTAEIPKGRYWDKMGSFPYQSRGAGRRLKGGVGTDDEEEEESEGYMTPDESEMGERPPTFSEGPPSVVGNLGDFEEYDPGVPVGTEFSLSKIVDNMNKIATMVVTTNKYFNSNIKKKMGSISRNDYMDFIDDEISLINEIKDNLVDNIEPYISSLKVALQGTKDAKYGEEIRRKYIILRDLMVGFYNNVESSKNLYVEQRRTGAGMMHGGAMGGVPILSSIRQYQHIPTKYML